MQTTIITSRVIVGNYHTEINASNARRVVCMETVKHVEYDMPGRECTTVHYSYNVIESVSWYQNKGYACDVKGAIQFGHSSQGIGNTLPAWAV